MDHVEAAKLELEERAKSAPRDKFKGVSNYAVKRAMELSPEEFEKLGTPMLKGRQCNCKDGGRMVGQFDCHSCLRCGGSEY